MADEVGISAKLGRLLPPDQMKDSGGKVSDREIPLKKRKKRQGENSPATEGEEEEIPAGERDPSSGKILDIVI